MDSVVIWIGTIAIIVALVALATILPFSIIPRRPPHRDESPNQPIRDAQDEAEVFYRRQPPVG